MSRGVIYVALGDLYVTEALQSAASLKASVPGLPVTLFCNRKIASPHIDRVVGIEGDEFFPGCAAKIPHMVASPYERTLFLDSDTYVCGDLADLFDLLDAFDLAAAHAPAHAIYEVDSAPDSFPEYNTGVILFRRSPGVEAFFASWASTFERYLARLAAGELRWLRPTDQRFHLLNDQGAFREALYGSSLRIATLAPEYNCRFTVPGYVDGPVKILHGRAPDLSQVAAGINAATTRRGYEERAGALRLSHYIEASSDTYSLANIRYTFRRRGLRWTMNAAAGRIFEAARRAALRS